MGCIVQVAVQNLDHTQSFVQSAETKFRKIINKNYTWVAPHSVQNFAAEAILPPHSEQNFVLELV